MFKQVLLGSLLVASSSLSWAAGIIDDHDHDDDHGHEEGEGHGHIIMHLEDGAIEIENGEYAPALGGKLFETEFGASLGGANTDNPGFVLEDGSGLSQTNVLAYEATGTLQFWDNGAWTASSDTLTIVDNSVLANTLIGGVSVSNPLGVISFADDEGGVHSHITSFGLNAGAASGAYMIELVVKGFASFDTSTGALGADLGIDSDAFFIAFNHGLDDEVFEGIVEAAAVPVPAAVWFFASALGAMGAIRRFQA